MNTLKKVTTKLYYKQTLINYVDFHSKSSLFHCLDHSLHNRNNLFLSHLFFVWKFSSGAFKKGALYFGRVRQLRDWAHTYLYANYIKCIDSCSFMLYITCMSRMVMLWNAIGIQTFWYERLETIQMVYRRRGLLNSCFEKSSWMWSLCVLSFGCVRV